MGVVLEATGNTSVALEARNFNSVNGVVSYPGIYRQEQQTKDAGEVFNNLVLSNRISFGSMNVNRTYFLKRARDLSQIKK